MKIEKLNKRLFKYFLKGDRHARRLREIAIREHARTGIPLFSGGDRETDETERKN